MVVVFINSTMKIVTYLSLFCIVFASCNRKEFKLYVGTYNCIKSIHTWEEGEPHVYENTADHEIHVEKNKKRIQVLDLVVPIDEIEPGQEYRKGSDTKYQSVRFENDLIYFLEHTSVAGGGYEVSYIGKKVEEN